MGSRTCLGLWSWEKYLAVVGTWTADRPVHSPVAVVIELHHSVLTAWCHAKYCGVLGVIPIPSFITGNSHHVEHKNDTSSTTYTQYAISCKHFLGPSACNLGCSLKPLYKFPPMAWYALLFLQWMWALYQSSPVLCDMLVLSPSCCYFVLSFTATQVHSSAFHKIRVHILNWNLSFHATCSMHASLQYSCVIVPKIAQLSFSRNHESDPTHWIVWSRMKKPSTSHRHKQRQVCVQLRADLCRPTPV